jgi:hypothetical protein
MHRRGRNTTVLWVLVLLSVAYGSLLYALRTLTGTSLLDGIIGVILGLYVCSHPAANTIDLLFLERGGFHQLSSEWAGMGWLALNVLVMVAGCLVIAIGTTQFVARAG